MNISLHENESKGTKTNEELLPLVVCQETQQPEQDEPLLQRQRLLQDEAQNVLKELNLVELLSAGGVVRQTGSTVLGLMVWRDIDLQVSSPGLSIERAFEIMHPLLTYPRVKQVRYLHQSDRFKLADLDERYFFMVYYEHPGQAEWKLDISFWLDEGVRLEPLHDAIEQQLTSLFFGSRMRGINFLPTGLKWPVRIFMMPFYSMGYIHSANSINTLSSAENPRAQKGSSFFLSEIW